jgi:hypothetical protein
VGIEVKASERWRPESGAALRELLERKAIRRAVAVYLGERPQLGRGVLFLPARDFAQQLGELLA